MIMFASLLISLAAVAQVPAPTVPAIALECDGWRVPRLGNRVVFEAGKLVLYQVGARSRVVAEVADPEKCRLYATWGN